MTDDDFDKVDVDEDFADEFDFVDDNKSSGAPTASQPTVSRSSSGSSFIGKFFILMLLLGGGYYGYSRFMAPQKDKGAVPNTDATKPATDVNTENSVNANPADNAAPAIPAPDMTAPTAQPAPVADDAAVDFNQALSNAQAAADSTSKDKLAEALPNSKSFAQVQKDLKSANTAKMVIPDEINATLDSISEEMTLNVTQIKQLEATITNLAASVEQLNKSISAMDNRVLGLTETVDALSQDLSNVKKIMTDEDLDLTSSSSSIKFSNKKQAQPLKSNAAEYSVHAIIPGRAWLKSSSGQILTVTEGDKVSDYGTVAVIDAANGLVRTSSGITFR